MPKQAAGFYEASWNGWEARIRIEDDVFDRAEAGDTGCQDYICIKFREACAERFGPDAPQYVPWDKLRPGLVRKADYAAETVTRTPTYVAETLF